MKDVCVGLLGGGQLARMLVEAAHDLGLTTRVLCPRKDEPAALVAREWVEGDPNQVEAAVTFLDGCDLLSFENEFVPAPVLTALAERAEDKVRPSPGVLFELQNKIRQKMLLERLGIPAAAYLVPEWGERADHFVERAWLALGGPCVLKWAELGYDGKGTCLAHDFEEALSFVREAFANGRELFAEARVDFDHEVAILGCRSVMGDFVTWPLVRSVQMNGVCSLVTGPAVRLGTPPELQLEADLCARKIAEELNYQGTFAVEMFVDREGKLFVNELAPRVHNSGHYTMDASETSQFHNHWRALMGLSLGETRPNCEFFAMQNLLGPESASPIRGPFALPALPNENLFLHWYQKGELRPGRKMGHVNGTALDAEEFVAITRWLALYEAEWARSLLHTSKKEPL